MSDMNKIQQIHNILPKHFNSKTNTNWKALVAALGAADQDTADLVEQVKQQFFVKTASRPYLDRLAANNKISRPKLVGMDDASFKQYIPVLSYQPKQVKLIIDQLLDIFFFKESTTAFITSSLAEPFSFSDGWELLIQVDEYRTDRIVFNSTEFTDISAATANEVVAAINRQAIQCYATSYYDSITKNTFIRLFTNTVGSKGSLIVRGGHANSSLRFNGFITDAGNGTDTAWEVDKIGEEVSFKYINGVDPNIAALQIGDIALIDLSGNRGSFEIKSVNLTDSSFTFVNLFGTPGSFQNTSENDVKFLRPIKNAAYLNDRRAMAWETGSSTITVEMPTSPPVVKRFLRGSVHVNGVFSEMIDRISDTSIKVKDAFQFPESGLFILDEAQEVQSRTIINGVETVTVNTMHSRSQYGATKYQYSNRTSLTSTGDIAINNNTIVNVSSTVGLSIGDQVVHPAFPANARVIQFDSTSVTLSVNAVFDSIGADIKFLGNTLYGIYPNIPPLESINEQLIQSANRYNNIVEITTISEHGFKSNELVIVDGCAGISVTNIVGDLTNNSNIVSNIADTSQLWDGYAVIGTGIPDNAKIIAVNGNSITIDRLATSSSSGVSLSIKQPINGTYKIVDATVNSFTYYKYGIDGVSSTVGTARVERIGFSNSGSRVQVLSSNNSTNSRIKGPYIWDKTASFVLSSNKANIDTQIRAGKSISLLNISDNTIDPAGGYIVFDYGLNTQEGPVRYLYKPTANTIALDPSYIFKYNHVANCTIIAINHKGPHQISELGSEYSAYITDPSEARFILQDLIRSVKSAGIFVDFLIRYPEQVYGLLDVYNQQGLGAGQSFK